MFVCFQDMSRICVRNKLFCTVILYWTVETKLANFYGLVYIPPTMTGPQSYQCSADTQMKTV